MRKNKFILLIGIFFLTLTGVGQEVLIPTAANVKDEVLFLDTTKRLVSDGFFPVSYSEASYKLPVKDTLKSRSWVVRKLMKEHFIQLHGKDFFLTIDPLLEMNLGKEVLQKPPYYLFQNTRGAQAFGQLKNVVSFYTAFYENQARFVDYQRNYFTSRGELIPYEEGEYYKIANATVPNGGRTKPFKENGFDYASAVSYVRFTPIKQIAIQLGNQPRFFGWGYRSMLMSDNANNYTSLSFDFKITDNFTYSFLRGKQLNLIRKVYSSMVERPYERKGIGTHYLSYRFTPGLVVGIFESTVYLRDEAKDYQKISKYFYIPVIGLNSVAKGGEKDGVKNVLGLNAAWKFHPQHLLYGQFVSDNFSHSAEYGFQLGYRLGNPFKLKNFRLQIEYNQASSHLFSATNNRIAYTHFNLPLAHTLGNGFNEVVFRLSYKWKGIYLDGELVYYRSNQPMQEKSALFESNRVAVIYNPTTVMYANVELGYELNAATRFRIFVGGEYRTSSSALDGKISYGTARFGVRSSLRNQYFDF